MSAEIAGVSSAVGGGTYPGAGTVTMFDAASSRILSSGVSSSSPSLPSPRSSPGPGLVASAAPPLRSSLARRSRHFG